MSTLLRAAATVLLVAGARAEVLNVPGDFASIQAAVDGAEPGDEVVVAGGVYEETLLIFGKTDVTVRGQGAVILHGGSALEAVVTVSQCVDVRLERLRIEQAASAAVLVDGCLGAVVARCRVEDSAFDGIVVDASLATIVERCRVRGSGFTGVRVVNSDGSVVSRCRVEGGNTNIVLTDTDNVRVERCRLVEPSNFGIVVGFPAAATGCTLRRNVIVKSGAFGIDVLGALSTLRDNRIVAPAGDGLLIEAGASSSVIEDNVVIAAGGSGLRVQATEAVVRRNRIVKPAGSGLTAEANNPTLTDNTLLSVAGTGIVLGSGLTQGVAAGNRLMKSGAHGFEIGGTGLLLHDNLVLGSTENGFFLTELGNTLVGNTAKGSGGFDLLDVGGGPNTYVGNDFGTINIQ